MVKVRIGQVLFKNKLLTQSCECVICKLNIRTLLRPSHCKPWKIANNMERLDVNNGLLLCPTHDALFDSGLISFRENGNIMILSKISQDQFKLLNINNSISLKFKIEQKMYMKYHRENLFK